MLRYFRLFGIQVRTSLVLGMQYRWEFLIDGALSLFWAVAAVLPLWVLGAMPQRIPGWSYPELVVLFGWFVLLKGILDGAVNPSLVAVVEHIRQGTLDFILLKPADAQFLVSTARFDLWKMTDVPTGMGMIALGLHMVGRWPTVGELGAALLMLVAASLMLYSLWIVVVSAAFYVVRLDNLSYLFMSIFDFARWPVSVFGGALRIVFTFVIPLAVMTNYPALALLGRMRLEVGAAVLGGSLFFLLLARLIWLKAIGRYTSASS
jgi:ABC-2 type transport system permease protein